MWRAFREAVASGEPQEYEVLASGGENGARWYSTRMAPVKVDGEVRRVVLVSQDITTRRAMEEAPRRALELWVVPLGAACLVRTATG